ncbi:phenylacetyl-CoA ligase [Infundibulicybe gibba]|nr:phenylacetyl-CoA ligase [Infundibulicybe gibba]
MEIHSPSAPLPPIPDDLTVPQFIFGYQSGPRPQRDPSIPWLVDDETGRGVGGDELKRRSLGLANALSFLHGIILLFSRNHLDYPVAIWAVHTLGGVITGANPDFESNELLHQLTATRASFLIAHPSAIRTATSAATAAGIPLDRVILFDAMDAPKGHKTIDELVRMGLGRPMAFVERKLEPGEAKKKLALLSFSSGTTGKPKAVEIPHFALIANIIQMAAHNRVNEDYCDWEERRYRPGDVAVGVHYIFRRYRHLYTTQMSVVVIPKFSFVGMLKSIVRHKITHLFLVPPQVVLLCKHPATRLYPLQDHVRMIMCGGAPLSHEMNEQLFALFPKAHIGQAYGLTETCTAITMWPINKKQGTPGSGGQLLPGIIARVVKPDGTLVGYDEPGELVVYSPANAMGYLDNEHATKESFVDGWVLTGDEVKIDRNGEIWILDRLKVRGFQVAPAEVEGCLLDHPDVSNACVVGILDEYSGEIPMAFVVLTADAQKRLEGGSTASGDIAASIIKHVASNKVAYKHLAGGVEFVKEIPISPSGKLLRRVLRERARAMRRERPSGWTAKL